jgi:autophagy-related protein 11
MDDPVPTIDFSPTGSSDSVYSFERADVEGKHCLFFPLAYKTFSPVMLLILLSLAGLLHVLDDLENYVSSTNDAIGLRAVQESRIAMEKLIVKMDNLESGFDKIAERSRKFTMPLCWCTPID